MNLAIIVAGGRGSRTGSGIPKQYRSIGGRPVIARTIEAFAGHGSVDRVLVVVHPDDELLFAEAARGLEKMLPPVHGGETRQESVRLGLEAAALHRPEIVLIHDAARPLLSSDLISAAVTAARQNGAAVPATPIVDSLVSIDGDKRTGSVDRASVVAVQTPQAFRFTDMLEAHRRAAAAGVEATDDGAVAAAAGIPVVLFPGETQNIKITHPEDFVRAETILLDRLPDIRVGNGFDVHAFGHGDHIMLGGVRIPHDQGLVGHSDADVGLHALTDAVLGAIASGDIGSHFPPSDMKWHGAASHIFLAEAARLVAERGGVIANLDLTVIGEAPKVGPWRDEMREAIAAIVGIPVNRVAVKATTTERLGFTGRREGLAAQATATVRLPLSSEETS